LCGPQVPKGWTALVLGGLHCPESVVPSLQYAKYIDEGSLISKLGVCAKIWERVQKAGRAFNEV